MEVKNEGEINLIQEVITRHFAYSNLVPRGNVFIFDIQDIYSDFEEIRKDFVSLGYYPFLRKKEGRRYCILARARKGKIPDNPLRHIVLFALTLVTTTWAGYLHAQGLVKMGYNQSLWLAAFSFSIGLMLILGSHEMAHKFTAMKNKIDSTWPYFIPLPPPFILGTMGAVIRIKSPITNRNSAVELGASGPLAGILVSIPILILGLEWSFSVPISEIPAEGIVYYFGKPLLFSLLQNFIINIPPGHTLFIHPLALAGWAGLFVTSINLIPVGQLDGGHIARALLGEENYLRASYAVIGIMLILGFTLWGGWLVWALFAMIMTRAGHPGAMDEISPLGRKQKIIALVTGIVFILCIIPVPIAVK